MYRRQIGLKPILNYLVSALLFLISVYMSIELIVTSSRMDIPFIAKAIGVLIPWMIFTLPILFYSSKYPEFHLTKEGIQYRFFLFFGGLIKWDEISEFISVEYPKSMKGTYALVINREGYRIPFRFKGLYFQSMHAIRLRTYSPVLLITSDSISDEERMKIKEKVNRQT